MNICTRCSGSGSAACPDCEGTGRPYSSEETGVSPQQCTNCLGKGTVACPACGGKGEIEGPPPIEAPL